MEEQNQVSTEVASSGKHIIVIGAAGNAIALITNDLFNDIDFSGIVNAIDNIGGRTNTLSQEEKGMANQIVSQWESDVISRLKTKGNEMTRFLNFFGTAVNGVLPSTSMFEDIGEELANKTNTTSEYKEVIAALEALFDHQQLRPQEAIEREDRTFKEKLEDEQKYKLEVARYDLNRTRLEREVYLTDVKWKKLLNENKEVKELIKRARHYHSNVGKFNQLCHDKAQLAKLNITVDDELIRKELRTLLDFTVTI